MKKIAKYMVAVCVIALAGALIAGCSGQGSSSAASSGASAQTTDELIAELDGLVKSNDYKSVTMDMKGSMKIDYAKMFASDDEEESSASAEASDASASASAEASDASASAEASDASASAESSESSTEMEIPMNITAKADKSGDTMKMYMTMDMMGQNMEMYINGNDAVMVIMGQAVSATLDELGMSQYGSIDSIMESQGGSLEKVKDAIQSIEKSTENGETIYKITCDPSKVAQSDTNSTLSQLGGSDTLKSMDLVYHVDSNGRVTGIDIDMQGKGFSSDITTTLYDYDATTVPDAPEATMKYSDIAGGAANETSASEASASSEAAKAA